MGEDQKKASISTFDAFNAGSWPVWFSTRSLWRLPVENHTSSSAANRTTSGITCQHARGLVVQKLPKGSHSKTRPLRKGPLFDFPKRSKIHSSCCLGHQQQVQANLMHVVLFTLTYRGSICGPKAKRRFV